MVADVVIDTDYLLSTLSSLIRIRSVLPEEEAIATFIAAELREMGVEPEWDEVSPGRPNVSATIPLGTRDRFLVFSGHSDTVEAASDWQTKAFEMIEKDGRLYGLGIVNMKAGLACQLAAFKALLEAYPPSDQAGSLVPGRLGLAVTVDQEGSSRGARPLLKTRYRECDAMLHAEHFFGASPQDYLPIAGTGKLLYRLMIRGPAAHAFRPHRGVNAVDAAARIVSCLDRLPLGEHADVGKGTVSTLKIDGGYKEYSIVVPEKCEVIITRLTLERVNTEMSLHVLAYNLRRMMNLVPKSGHSGLPRKRSHRKRPGVAVHASQFQCLLCAGAPTGTETPRARALPLAHGHVCSWTII